MKKSVQKNFFREIKGSPGRFLSILFIVALGVAFFSGVRATEPDMRLSINQFVREHDYMDVKVLSTLGLTEEDRQEILKIPGVTRAEGSWQMHVFSTHEDETAVLELMSIMDSMNRISVTEGRLPEKKEECLADELLAEQWGLKTGDRITVSSGTEDPLSDSICTDTFTITGIGRYPGYLTETRDSAKIGSGSVAGFLALPPSAFCMDTYTAICLRTDALNELDSYSQEYKDQIDDLADRLEQLKGPRCLIRLDELNQEIRDGEKEIREAKKELADAERELEDGREKLADGRQTLSREEADTRQKLQDSREQLEDGKKQLAEGFSQYEENKEKLTESEKELEKQESALKSGKKKLDSANAQYQAGKAESADGKKQLDTLKEQMTGLEKQIQEMKDQQPLINEKLTELTGQKETLGAAIEESRSQLTQLNLQRDALKEQLRTASESEDGTPETGSDSSETVDETAQLQAKLEEGEAGIAALNQAITEMDAQKAQLDAGLEELTAQKSALETGLEEAEAGYEKMKEAYETGLQEWEAGERQLAEAKESIEQGEAKLSYAENSAKIENGKARIRSAKKQLSTGYQTLTSRQTELENGFRTLKKGIETARQEFAKARQTLQDNEGKLADAQKEIADGKRELRDAQKELTDAKEKIEALGTGEWYILDRSMDQAFAEYDADADKIGAIGKVFPLVFFLVAALVSLTTMTRMVEEQRGQIGVFEALGYGKGVIIWKFAGYSLLATVTGSILGILIGEKLFPYVIVSAYGNQYRFMDTLLLPYEWKYALMAALAAILCNLIATLWACGHLLKSNPAQLMRPPAPKHGNRIFLEYIPGLWKHLSFNMKSTLRNLFRYKKRLFMTMIGIGGCTALILTGFGIRDSVNAVTENQYGIIWTYDLQVSFDPEAGAKDLQEMEMLLEQPEEIETAFHVYQKSIDIGKGQEKKEGYLIVPLEPEKMDAVIHLRNRQTGRAITLNDSGTVLTEKISNLLQAEADDSVALTMDDDQTAEAKVTAVSENYLMHYAYLSADCYQKLFKKEAEANTVYLRAASQEEEQIRHLKEKLLKNDAVLSVSSAQEAKATILNTSSLMGVVIGVLTGAAGILAFIVIFNLNNISITERRREMATLKVLGFYDGEVAGYVYRENVFLTVFGIAIGLLFGIYLHHFIMNTAETEILMFGRILSPLSYLAAIALTGIFAVLVNAISYFSLRRINMIESLKSVE